VVGAHGAGIVPCACGIAVDSATEGVSEEQFLHDLRRDSTLGRLTTPA
jgi:hypothetical protein